MAGFIERNKLKLNYLAAFTRIAVLLLMVLSIAKAVDYSCTADVVFSFYHDNVRFSDSNMAIEYRYADANTSEMLSCDIPLRKADSCTLRTGCLSGSHVSNVSLIFESPALNQTFASLPVEIRFGYSESNTYNYSVNLLGNGTADLTLLDHKTSEHYTSKGGDVFTLLCLGSLSLLFLLIEQIKWPLLFAVLLAAFLASLWLRQKTLKRRRKTR